MNSLVEDVATASCAFDIAKLKKYPGVVVDDSLMFIPMTVTGVTDPNFFQVKLEDVNGEVAKYEKMMTIFFACRPQLRRTVEKGNLAINGFYAGYNTDRKKWCRVQVMYETDQDVEKPIHVFLIDHGVYMDLKLEQLSYLYHFYCPMRYAFNATFAHLPDEPPTIIGSSVSVFLQECLRRPFEFLMDEYSVEELDDGPLLKLRFLSNLD